MKLLFVTLLHSFGTAFLISFSAAFLLSFGTAFAADAKEGACPHCRPPVSTEKTQEGPIGSYWHDGKYYPCACGPNCTKDCKCGCK